MESDEVGAEQALDDLAPPRHLHEQLDRRERDVQEEADGEIGAQHPQHLRHQLQLVVLDPDGGALRGGLRGGLGETPVHLDVGVPPFTSVLRLDDHVVVQRPQSGVGEALVVVGDLLTAERHGIEVETVLDDGFEVDVGDAGPAHPRPLVAAQDRFEGGDEPAGAALPAGRTVGKSFEVDRQAIGDHDEVGASVYGAGLVGARRALGTCR